MVFFFISTGDIRLDSSSIINYFSEVLQHSLDLDAPYITRTMSRRSAPWITADIKKLCKERYVLNYSPSIAPSVAH